MALGGHSLRVTCHHLPPHRWFLLHLPFLLVWPGVSFPSPFFTPALVLSGRIKHTSVSLICTHMGTRLNSPVLARFLELSAIFLLSLKHLPLSILQTFRSQGEGNSLSPLPTPTEPSPLLPT